MSLPIGGVEFLLSLIKKKIAGMVHTLDFSAPGLYLAQCKSQNETVNF